MQPVVEISALSIMGLIWEKESPKWYKFTLNLKEKIFVIFFLGKDHCKQKVTVISKRNTESVLLFSKLQTPLIT